MHGHEDYNMPGCDECNLAMMQAPDKWPLWPILPVKQLASGMGFPRLGIMREAAFGVQPVVYLVDLGTLSTPQFKAAHQSWDSIEHTTYPDFDGLLDDGWVVD